KSPATVEIYDLAGRRVAREEVAAGCDECVWRPGGEALSPGVYLYWVEGREQEETGKIVITR
ncbi:MAG TPA: T9SS type A sorting domain-containing protein, partial [bacterium]|nr:T9SS type A sorting domain-containing protein [bacterium]